MRRARTAAARASRLPRRMARRWLTWSKLARGSALFGLVYLAATVVGYRKVLMGSGTVTSVSGLIGGDYVAFYSAGRMLLSGAGSRLYDRSPIVAIEGVATGGRVAGLYDPFRNPPFFAVPFLPLSLLDRVPSFAVWTALSLAMLVAAVWLALDVLPELRARWRAVACLLFGFAPVYFGLVDGQNACLSLLLYVLAYRALLRDRQGQAGVWAALGSFKPQLFVLLPLVFLFSRRWKALGTYAAVLGGLAVASYALVGASGLLGWARVIFGYEGVNAAKQAPRMYDLKSFWDQLLPAQPTLALGLTLACTVALVLLLLRVWRKPESRPGALGPRWAFTILAGVLVAPHLLDYDLTVLVLAGLLLAVTIPDTPWWVLGVYVLLLADGPLQGGGRALQLAVPVMAALAVRVWWRIERQGASPLAVAYSHAAVPGARGGAAENTAALA